MAYGNKHNPDSFASGESKNTRNNEQIFRDAFQGKLAEVAFFNYYSKDFKINEPNFDEWERGFWEDTDFIAEYNGLSYRISIKSTKHFGNLLLLEKNRYNSYGLYIESAEANSPGIKHDVIFLIRIKGINNSLPEWYDYAKLEDIKAEITGYIKHEDFLKAIEDNKCLEKGWIINGKEKLKVDNYYFCCSELKEPKND